MSSLRSAIRVAHQVIYAHQAVGMVKVEDWKITGLSSLIPKEISSATRFVTAGNAAAVGMVKVEDWKITGLSSLIPKEISSATRFVTAGNAAAVGMVKVEDWKITGLSSLIPKEISSATRFVTAANAAADSTNFPLMTTRFATAAGAAQASRYRGVLWNLTKRGYQLVKGKVKEIIPDFPDVVDAVDYVIDWFSKDKSIDVPSPDLSPPSLPVSCDLSPPSLPVSCDLSPPSPPVSRGLIAGMALLALIAGMALSARFFLAIVTLNEPEISSISTFCLGNQKILGKSTINFDFVGIFSNQAQCKYARHILTDSAMTDGQCREFLNTIACHMPLDFIVSIVCGGFLYLAKRGEYRILTGFADPGEDITLRHLGLLRTGDHWTTVLPISELDHFLLISSPNISEAFNDYELVDLVSRTQDRKNVSQEIVRRARDRRPALDLYVAVIFFR